MTTTITRASKRLRPTSTPTQTTCNADEHANNVGQKTVGTTAKHLPHRLTQPRRTHCIPNGTKAAKIKASRCERPHIHNYTTEEAAAFAALTLQRLYDSGAQKCIMMIHDESK